MSLPRNNKSRGVYTIFNKVELVRGGEDYFERLEQLIKHARYTIHLQTYIFNEDETGNRIAAALLNAVQRGVKIFIVVDGYASRNLSKEFISNLKAAGIFFRWFNPIFKSRYFYFGRRLHHKVIVADASVSLVGGINITNRYSGFNEPAWLDWAVYAQGEISQKLNKICIDIWNKSYWGKSKRTRLRHPVIPNLPSAECFVRARVNDWVRGKKQISKSYIDMLKTADNSVTIMSSYFLPGSSIRKNIIAASKRGVKIKLIVAGVSDVYLAKQAERHMYSWVLKNNIELYEYTKTVLHGKLSVCDHKWTTIGSYNINNISAYASIELNLDVLNERFTNETQEILQKIIEEDCVRITPETYKSNDNILIHAWQRICYDMYRLILYLFTFYFKRQHG